MTFFWGDLMTLLSDMARCCESDCDDRESCARWVERSTGRAYALRGGEPGGECPFYIQADPMQSHD